jgi:hypothetical protein
MRSLQKGCSFLKKRTKRLLFQRQRQDPGPRLRHWDLDLGSGGRTKVFCFFSSEKKSLLPFDFIAQRSKGVTDG